MTRRDSAWIAFGAVLASLVALAVAVLHPMGIDVEERALAFGLGFAHRRAEPEVVIALAQKPADAAALAQQVEGLLAARAVAVGMLVPVADVAAAGQSGDDALAVALRRTKRVAVSVRVTSERALLPPSRLAAELPLGFRECDRPRKGALSRRLWSIFGESPLQSMAVATLLAARGRGETQVETRSFGRLPFDRPSLPAVIAPGAIKPDQVAGRIVLVSTTVEEAQATADSLVALLRAQARIDVGWPDLLFVLFFAVVGAMTGCALRLAAALSATLVLWALAMAASLGAATKGRPILVLAPTLSLLLGAVGLALRRQVTALAHRGRIRRVLAPRTSVEVAIDLAADPSAVAPVHRKVCVLVASLTGRPDIDFETDGGSSTAATLLLEAHEERVLEVARRFGGIVDRFDGDRVVVLFGVAGAADALALAERASLLAVRAALEIVRLARGRAAIGLDVGTALCGMYGADPRYRAQGEVIYRAERAAAIAAQGGVAVVATDAVHHEVEQRMMARTMGRQADLLLFEILEERSGGSYNVVPLPQVH